MNTEKIAAAVEESGAETAAPATDEEIARCNEELAGYGLEPLPDEYAAFLKIYNGFERNGVELKGVKSEANGKDSSFNSQNIAKSSNYLLGELGKDLGSPVLWLGGAHEGNYLLYDYSRGKYQIRLYTALDKAEREYSSFEEFFYKEVIEGSRYAPIPSRYDICP